MLRPKTIERTFDDKFSVSFLSGAFNRDFILSVRFRGKNITRNFLFISVGIFYFPLKVNTGNSTFILVIGHGKQGYFLPGRESRVICINLDSRNPTVSLLLSFLLRCALTAGKKRKP